MNIQNRTIYCKDNLDILRGIDTGTVDMIYLDPPFNSKKQWNAPIGSSAEGASFKDTWSDDDIKSEWVDAIRAEWPELHAFITGMKLWAEPSDVGYITYMAIRIIECRRILKDTGSLFYHCDHVMNDYVKVMLDTIFGRHRDVNNIVWCYKSGGVSKRWFAKKHDNIFMYSKTKEYKFNPVKEKSYNSFVKGLGKIKVGAGYQEFFKDEKGTYSWVTAKDYWNIPVMSAFSKERTGYPTQKPLELLRKIIECSTSPGDFVLDPFCGCATTCVAAEQLDRKWVGIDVSKKAHDLVQQRLNADVSKHGQLEIGQSEFIEVGFTTTPPKRNAIDERESKYVYVISNDSYPGEYKVGIATNVKSRLNSYQTSDPNRGYKLLYSVKTPDYSTIEKAVHNHFDNRHEWVRAELESIQEFIESNLKNGTYDQKRIT